MSACTRCARPRRRSTDDELSRRRLGGGDRRSRARAAADGRACSTSLASTRPRLAGRHRRAGSTPTRCALSRLRIRVGCRRDGARRQRCRRRRSSRVDVAAGPLAGIRVLDFGFAVAGPWTSQLLADLGADVISIDAPGYHAAWPLNHMGMGVNKSKRHLTLDIKNPARGRRAPPPDRVGRRDHAQHATGRGRATRHRVREGARDQPGVIYLHTRAFDDGPRSALGGHDQAANALGGTMWEDGGSWNGGHPYFGLGSGGDKGNGFLGAVAVVDALYDRDRNGQRSEGRHVDPERRVVHVLAHVHDSRRQAVRPSEDRRRPARLQRAVPAVRVRVRMAAASRCCPTRTGTGCASAISALRW